MLIQIDRYFGFLLSIIRKGQVLCQKIPEVLKAIRTGYRLGSSPKNKLHSIDERYFGWEKKYTTETYNKQGFYAWEEEMANKYFVGCNKILIGAVGGGREAYAFEKRGCAVDAFECNPKLVAFANGFLEKEGLRARVVLTQRDECLVTGQIYDGAVVGWGAYMSIQGRNKRIAFIKKMREQLKENAPLLLSFWVFPTEKVSFRHTVIFYVGRTLRWLLRESPLELGDEFYMFFGHVFTRQEIQEELEAAGFKLACLVRTGFGHAVGLAS
ncbi:MAG: SAM-dependent methyltransferase [Candidatus Margulisiibacteriota bacterium]